MKSKKTKLVLLIIFVAALAFPAALVSFGWGYQVYSQSKDNRTFHPPGKLIDVNGYLMHIHCRGSGSPTVVIEQGIGGQSLAWNEIHKKMANITRTCAYDRAGMGYSQPVDKPTLSADVANNLNLLLDSAGIDDGFIFLAWSAGGLYARDFYKRFPDKVKGMLLVDSSHEQQTIRMPPPDNQANIDRLNKNHFLSRVGYLRFSGYIEHQFHNSPLPKEDVERLIAIYLRSHTYKTLVNEAIGLEIDLAENSQPPSLGNIPVIVIAEGKPNNTFMQEHLKNWHEMQLELANLSTIGRLIIAENSAHAIHRSEPELILEALKSVVESVRTDPKLN